MWPALIAAGIGLMQGMEQDKAAKRAMQMQAEQNRYAPIFGQAPGQFQSMNTSNALSGALAGGMGGWQTAMNYDLMKKALESRQPQTQITANPVTGNDLAMNFGRQNPYDNLA